MHQPDDQIGSYRILERIGGGGTGYVYRAVHALIGRQVALKILKRELAQRHDVVQRFIDEARAVNDIGHPNIIDVFDFVVDSSEQPPLFYMVMELLSGHDLSSHIAMRGALPPAVAISIGAQIADALTAVHERQILHRDLKASNIFVTQADSDTPQVKVLDFGALKFMDQTPRRADLTQPGTAVGTPLYMAPEQIMDRPLDCRTDIYALGGILYKMLVGHVPFPDNNANAALVNAVKTQPKPVSQARKASSPVSPALEAVVMCCLEKRPADRFDNMQELKRALTSSASTELSGDKVVATAARISLEEPTANIETLTTLGSKRWRWALVTLLVVGIAAAALVLGWRESTRSVVPVEAASVLDHEDGTAEPPSAPVATQDAPETPTTMAPSTEQTEPAAEPPDRSEEPQRKTQEASRGKISRKRSRRVVSRRRPRPRSRSRRAPVERRTAIDSSGAKAAEKPKKKPSHLTIVDPFDL